MASRTVTPEDTQAKRTLDACLTRSAYMARKYQLIAEVNESFCFGNQWGGTTYRGDERQVDKNQWFDDENLPRLYVNKLANLNLTLASLLTRNRPTVKAVPASSEPEDTFRAQVAQNVLENLRETLDTAWKTHQMVISAGQHGVSAMKIVFDVERDAVTWDTCTIFDVYLDPRCEDYRKSAYCAFVHYRDVDDVEQLLSAAGHDRPPPTTSYRAATGEVLEGVACWELWHKPSKKHPKGLYAYFVDDVCVERIDEYPYTFTVDDASKPEYLFPLVLIKMRNVRGNLYGHTNLTDCIPLQRTLNEVNSRVLHMWRKTSHVVQILPKEQEDSFTPGKDTELWMPMAQAEQARSLGYMQTFNIPPILLKEREYYLAEMNEVMGLNAITSGVQTRSISGRAIENIVELDAQKNADVSKSIEDAERDAWNLTLRLVQRYYTRPRIMRISDGTSVDVAEFVGADIEGVDVRLEPASELDSLSDAKGLKADERLQAGLPPEGQREAEMLRTSGAAAFAEHIVSDYLAGKPTPDIDAESTDLGVVLDVVTKHMMRAQTKNKRDDWIALDAFARQLRALAHAPGPAPGPGEQPPPTDAPPAQQGLPQ